jgi:hypothetical protein
MTRTDEKQNSIDFKNLSNEELIVIYAKFNSVVKTMDDDLSKKRYSKKTKTPFGKGLEYISLSEDKVEEIKSSKPYLLSKSVVNKLKPIVELIVDCDVEMKELYNQIK